MNYSGTIGGCGDFNCTSLENYFIEDHTGEILGGPNRKALPNNVNFSSKVSGCQFVS